MIRICGCQFFNGTYSGEKQESVYMRLMYMWSHALPNTSKIELISLYLTKLHML